MKKIPVINNPSTSSLDYSRDYTPFGYAPFGKLRIFGRVCVEGG